MKYCGHKTYWRHACHCMIKPMNVQQQHSSLYRWSSVGPFLVGHTKMWALEIKHWGRLFFCYGFCINRFNTAYLLHVKQLYIVYSVSSFSEIFYNSPRVRANIGQQIINFVLGEAEPSSILPVLRMHAGTCTCTQYDGKLMNDHQTRQCPGIDFIKCVQSKISLC